MPQEYSQDHATCRRCEQFAMPSGNHGVCETCRLALIPELAMPALTIDDVGMFLIKKDEHRIGFYGIHTAARPAEGPCYVPYGRPVRHADGSVEITAPGGYVQVWLAEVAYRSSPLYGELRWQPGTQIRTSIRGLERHHTEKDLLDARRGIALLQTVIPPAGRPCGSTKLPHDPTYLRGRYEEYEELVDFKTITRKDFAAYLQVDTKTLSSALDKAGLPWPPMLPE